MQELISVIVHSIFISHVTCWLAHSQYRWRLPRQRSRGGNLFMCSSWGEGQRNWLSVWCSEDECCSNSVSLRGFAPFNRIFAWLWHNLLLCTRAKHYLFIIARRRSIMVNSYWRQLVEYARERQSLIHVPILHPTYTPKANQPSTAKNQFPNLAQLVPVHGSNGEHHSSDSEYSA